MRKKRARNITLKLVLHLVVIHSIFSLIFAMSFNYIHPFTKITATLPVWLQTLILSVVGLAIYGVVGGLYALIKPTKKELRIGLERSVIFFTLGMMAIYAVVYFVALEFYNPDFMLIYCVVNPWFGTFIYKVPLENMFSLWWMVGTIVPGLGLYIGAKISLHKQEV